MEEDTEASFNLAWLVLGLVEILDIKNTKIGRGGIQFKEDTSIPEDVKGDVQAFKYIITNILLFAKEKQIDTILFKLILDRLV